MAEPTTWRCPYCGQLSPVQMSCGGIFTDRRHPLAVPMVPVEQEKEPRYEVRRDDNPEPAQHPETGAEDHGPAFEVWNRETDNIESDWFTEEDAQKEADRLNREQEKEPGRG